MKLETLWCVIDPTPRSTVMDICFETTPLGIVLGAVGAYVQGRERLAKREAMALYTTMEEATADAKARLAKRDGAK